VIHNPKETTMLSNFSDEALQKARKSLDQAHLTPPIETLVKAAIPLVIELLDKELASRAPKGDAAADPKSGAAARK
jgi:hypothetical protein